MKIWVASLFGLLGTGAHAECGEYVELDEGVAITLDCGKLPCNVLELDGTGNVLHEYGVDPVGTGTCTIEVQVYGTEQLSSSWLGEHTGNVHDEHTALIEHVGDFDCDTISIGVSKGDVSVGLTCSIEDEEQFSMVEGNFQAWCGSELPNERVDDGTISGSCLDNYISCWGWTQASDYGKDDPYEDAPICYASTGSV